MLGYYRRDPELASNRCCEIGGSLLFAMNKEGRARSVVG